MHARSPPQPAKSGLSGDPGPSPADENAGLRDDADRVIVALTLNSTTTDLQRGEGLSSIPIQCVSGRRLIRALVCAVQTVGKLWGAAADGR